MRTRSYQRRTAFRAALGSAVFAIALGLVAAAILFLELSR